jgi:hypothetical protein
LVGERIEKAEEKVGTKAGGDEGDDRWGALHKRMMEFFAGDGRPKIGQALRVRAGAQVRHKR